MTPPYRYRLSDREKDALLSEQAARIAELEGLLCRPRKTSRNSGLPPSCDQKPGRSGSNKGKAKPHPSRPGSARSLVDAPDETISRIDGTTQWHWVFVSAKAVLHQIARRAGQGPLPKTCWANIGPRCGPRTATPASRPWRTFVCSCNVLRPQLLFLDLWNARAYFLCPLFAGTQHMARLVNGLPCKQPRCS